LHPDHTFKAIGLEYEIVIEGKAAEDSDKPDVDGDDDTDDDDTDDDDTDDDEDEDDKLEHRASVGHQVLRYVPGFSQVPRYPQVLPGM